MISFNMPGQRFGRMLQGLGLCLVLGVAGCQTPSVFAKKETTEDALPERPAGELYNAGLASLRAGKVKDSLKSFEEVDRQYPYTEYARKAQIMMAFANYRAGDYDAAIAASKRFLSLYPGSPDAAYAQYIIGQSYYHQMPVVTRDQTATKAALDSMREIINNYPDSVYANDAREKIAAARDQLAGQEMQVGRYYEERRDYIAAINRFKVVVIDYPTTRHVEEALFRLTETNLAMGLSSEAQTAAAVLGHNFPDSQWYKDAYKLLATGGLEPVENKGSWISRAFKTVTG